MDQSIRDRQTMYGTSPTSMLRMLHPPTSLSWRQPCPAFPGFLFLKFRRWYHVISRTALDGLPFNGADKDFLQQLIQRYSRIYFTEILGYALMDNHFHLLVRMFPKDHVSDEELHERYIRAHGPKALLSKEKIPAMRQKWSSLSEMIKEIKQSFSRYYNKRHNRKGYLWGTDSKVSSSRTGAR